jgi:hypothetical protein
VKLVAVDSDADAHEVRDAPERPGGSVLGQNRAGLGDPSVKRDPLAVTVES